MKIKTPFFIIIILTSGCISPKYTYLKSNIVAFIKPSKQSIDRKVFPSNVSVKLGNKKQVLWTGIVTGFSWDQDNNLGTFSIEHRFLLYLPHRLTSSGTALIGHPGTYYVSRESDGNFDCSIKLLEPPSDLEIEEFKNKKFAISVIGNLSSSQNKIVVVSNYLERVPILGELEIIVPRDDDGNIIVDENGNIAFKLKEENTEEKNPD